MASAAAPAATQSHPQIALSKGNQVVSDALLKALGAIVLLNDQHVGIIEVCIRSGRAVIRIDQPPVDVAGAVSVSRPHGLLREELWVAPFRDCQLEWTGIVAGRRNVEPMRRARS